MSEREAPPIPDPAELGRLRAAFAEPGAPARRAEGDAEPIEADRVWAAARGELDPTETVALVDRLHRDPELALEWRLAVELAEAEAAELDAGAPDEGHEASAPGEASPVDVAAAANDHRYVYAGVLGLVAAAALALFFIGGDEPGAGDAPGTGDAIDSPPVLRAPNEDPAITSPLDDGAVLPRDRFELRWSPVPDALRYELRLSTPALDPIHEALELDGEATMVPASALAELEAGDELIWRVVAIMPDGARRSSPAMRVRLGE